MGEVYCQTVRTFEKSLYEDGGQKEYIKDGAFALLVDTGEVYELCTLISFQGREYAVCSVMSRLQGKELFNTYESAETRGIETPERVNREISGISLDGVVHKVSQDHLQIRFHQEVQSNDIEMMLWAWMESKWQYYFNNKNHERSVAIRLDEW